MQWSSKCEISVKSILAMTYVNDFHILKLHKNSIIASKTQVPLMYFSIHAFLIFIVLSHRKSLIIIYKIDNLSLNTNHIYQHYQKILVDASSGFCFLFTSCLLTSSNQTSSKLPLHMQTS